MPSSTPLSAPPFAAASRLLAATLLVLGMSLPGTGAAEAQLPGTPAAAAPASPLDALAEALLRVEYALRDRPAPPAERAALNRAFDQATLAFFAGQVDPVVAAMDALVIRIEPDAAVREAQAAEAAATVAALPERGRILGGTPAVPYRLVLPEEGGGGPPEAGYPVLVALHGAGGNEHMFVEAYGAGRLGALAREQGFVVISPATVSLAQRPDALAALLEAAEAEVPVDRSRVFLLGHSMGAGAAWAATLRDPGAVRAVVCVAGPCGAGAAAAGTPGVRPPLLVMAGGLDPISPPVRLEAAAAQARDAGWEVEVRTLDVEGHTLVVGAVLEDAVSWLMALPGRDP